MTFWIEPVKDEAGTRYWVLFTHGQFHNPTAVISHTEMIAIAERVMGKPQQIIDLGATVKSYRKRHKMTQQEFADQAGISRNYISQIERGFPLNLSIAVHQKITTAMVE